MHYVFGDYTLDTRRCELQRAGIAIPLRPKMFHLLTYLLAHRDRLVSRQELCEHIWPQQFISDATLDACLAQARRAVGDSGRTQRVLQTRHGYGYRFVAAVQVYDDPSSPAHESARMGAAQVGVSTGVDPALVPEMPSEPPAPLPPIHPPPLHALMGERKVVTALVCTLANAATWAQHPEAEALYHRMRAFFALVLEEVERYGGTLQRLLDDGALVLFGAPMAHEDHAQRAVLAALGLQQRLWAAGADPAYVSEEAFTVSMGLHTGQIVVGSLGDDGRLAFTPVGETTHLAACLAQQATPGTILVSDATARLVQGAVRLEAGPPVLSPEAPHPGTTYKVLGLGARHPSLAMHGGHPRSPFVGRQLELATLQALLTRVEGGQGQVVSLVGEAGMGKTRLVHEFQQRLGPTRVTCLEGGCDSYSQAIPYLPVQEILRQACGLVEADSAAVVTGHVQHYLQELGMTPAEEAPYLLSLLGIPDALAHLAGLSPQIIRARTFAALHQLLLRQSQRHPLLVVVENLHWSDPTSQEFLTELVERLAGMPLLLVVTCRPGYRPPWMDKSYATQITLPRLGPEDSQRVVQAVLPAAQLPEHLLRDILAKASGNPLFLEELAWAVREQGGCQLPPEIPVTVQALLAARIDRLPHGAKRLLQTAAVIGPEVLWPLLQAVAEVPEEDLRSELLQLQAAEFLYETRLVPEGIYSFKHALTHEVAYSSLLQERRRALHARIMAVIEKLYADRLAEQVERLAHHAFHGELWEKAVAYFRQAGDKALARSAYSETAVCLEQALRALQHLPATRDTLEQAIDLHLDLRAALIPPGEFDRLLAHLREAETLVQTLNDQRRLGRVSCYMSNCFTQMGDRDRGIEFGQRALAMAAALGDFALQVQTNYFLGQAYYSLGDHRQAMEVVRWNVASLEGDLLRESFGQGRPASVSARAVLVRCLVEVGEFAEGIVRGEEAVRIAEASDQPHSCLLASLRLGGLYLKKGDLPRAIPVLERGLERWQAYKLQRWFPTIASALGLARVLAGQVAEAMPLLEQTLEQATSMTSMNDHSRSLGRLSEAFLLTGRISEAIALARCALEHARVHKERGHEAHALWLFGEIAVHRDPPAVAEAETRYRQALAIAQALGMRPLQAHCHLGLGSLYARDGRREQARAELCTAIELYRAMEMTFWLPQAEVALRQARSSLPLPPQRQRGLRVRVAPHLAGRLEH